MAGDAAVADPSYSATMAITIGARPEHIWPWLVQLGYQRGGLYSYDWLDRLFGYLDRPKRSLHPAGISAVGGWGRDPHWARWRFPVTAIEPARALVLSGGGRWFRVGLGIRAVSSR